MNRFCTLALVLGLWCAPVFADGDFASFGSWWATEEAGDGFGGGSKVGLSFGRVIDLQLRATFFGPTDFLDRTQEIKVQVYPLELGLELNFNRGRKVNPVVGAGVSYFLLNTDRADIDNEVGWHAFGGFEFGAQDGVGFFIEAIFRKVTGEVGPFRLETSGGVVNFPPAAIDLTGKGANAGMLWRF